MTKEDAKRFLDAHKWYRPPTDPQMELAGRLSRQRKAEIYRDGGVLTHASVHRFIADQLSQARSPSFHAEFGGFGGIEGSVAGGFYSELQRSALAGMAYGDL